MLITILRFNIAPVFWTRRIFAMALKLANVHSSSLVFYLLHKSYFYSSHFFYFFCKVCLLTKKIWFIYSTCEHSLPSSFHQTVLFQSCLSRLRLNSVRLRLYNLDDCGVCKMSGYHSCCKIYALLFVC